MFLVPKPLLAHNLVIPLISFVAYLLEEFLVRDVVKSDVEIHVLYITLITLIYLQLLSQKNSSRF